jgi:hypothetical protein
MFHFTHDAWGFIRAKLLELFFYAQHRLHLLFQSHLVKVRHHHNQRQTKDTRQLERIRTAG